MSTKLGDNTKAAIRRIVDALPFLKADGNGIPTHQRPTIDTIRKNAAANANGPRDVQIEAAEAWATEELTAALEADNATGKKAASKAEPETEATVEHGGVALHEKADAHGKGHAKAHADEADHGKKGHK